MWYGYERVRNKNKNKTPTIRFNFHSYARVLLMNDTSSMYWSSLLMGWDFWYFMIDTDWASRIWLQLSVQLSVLNLTSNYSVLVSDINWFWHLIEQFKSKDSTLYLASHRNSITKKNWMRIRGNSTIFPFPTRIREWTTWHVRSYSQDVKQSNWILFDIKYHKNWKLGILAPSGFFLTFAFPLDFLRLQVESNVSSLCTYDRFWLLSCLHF